MPADHDEPLLADTPSRFTLFPLEHADIWAFYKKAQAAFWVAEEKSVVHDREGVPRGRPPCRLIGMNARSMCEYIEYLADHLLLALGLGAVNAAPNPFALSLERKTNFFERRVTEYKKFDHNAASDDAHEFRTDLNI
ncbi:Ribonucleoside-diphosphate reductase [Aphelenchoides fujianensis]|nr:Ribonucleoside-diphosphate reductase [Aphelenchoides fujianensis]